MGQYLLDRVCIYDSRWESSLTHIAPSDYIYEVRPSQPLEPDPEYPSTPFLQCCERAVVLRCVRKPLESTPPRT
jgi:hypothetical protein